jgi:hypothetical protein
LFFAALEGFLALESDDEESEVDSKLDEEEEGLRARAAFLACFARSPYRE